MSKQRQIQRNQEKHKSENDRKKQVFAPKDTHEINTQINHEINTQINQENDPKQNKNNWILFGFIALMCIIWGILYWIFIV